MNKCVCCGEGIAEDELITLEQDDFHLDCAEAAEIYRCLYCGKVYEKSDTCPECNTKKNKYKEDLWK